MAVLKFKKITGALPATLTPSTMYLVNNDNVLSIYITDKTGNAAIPLNTSSLTQADLLTLAQYFQNENNRQNSQGLLIPFYTASISDGQWTSDMVVLVDSIMSYHEVRHVVILKLGVYSDNRAIDRLKFAGAEVVGYIDADLTTQTTAQIVSAITTLKTAYPNIDGIFLDNIDISDKSAEYSAITNEIHKQGMSLSILNARQNVETSYFDAADIVVSYYGQGYPASGYYDGAMTDSPATQPYAKRAAMVFGTAYDEKNTAALLKTNSLVFITDGPDTFNYISAFVDSIDDLIARIYKPVNTPNISGPDVLCINQTSEFVITNYDNATPYSISAILGTIGILGDRIAYTAPGVPGNTSFTINGKEVYVSVVSAMVSTPGILSPESETVEVPSALDLMSSVFKALGVTDNHIETQWQLSTSPVFSSLFLDKLGTDDEKSKLTVSNLNAGTVYYARIRHKGETLGYSAWSPVISFTTRAVFFPTTEFKKLIPSNKSTNSYYGRSVAVDHYGDAITIGAYATNLPGASDTGLSYIYKLDSGTYDEAAVLGHAPAASNDYFGWSVDINDTGTIAVVGAYRKDLSGKSAAGQAYILELVNDTWVQRTILSPNDIASNDNFGWSVAISGDGNIVVIGSPGADPSGLSNAGAAYVFTRNGDTWERTAKLVANDGATGDSFGRSVSIAKTALTIVIGAPEADSGGIPGCGKVYVFNKTDTAWAQLTPLFSDVLGNNDYLGYAVDISADGKYLVAGAYNGIGSGQANAGYAIVYNLTGQTPVIEKRLTASDVSVGDNFGTSVSIDGTGTCVLVGSPLADPFGSSKAGAAYIFTRSGTVWTQQTKLTASDFTAGNQFGQSVAISGDGATAVIGASYNNPCGVGNAGAAYVYRI